MKRQGRVNLASKPQSSKRGKGEVMSDHKWIHRNLKDLAEAEATAAKYRKLPEVASAKVERTINQLLTIKVVYKNDAERFPRLK